MVVLDIPFLTDETITNIGNEFRARLTTKNEKLLVRGAEITVTEKPLFYIGADDPGILF